MAAGRIWSGGMMARRSAARRKSSAYASRKAWKKSRSRNRATKNIVRGNQPFPDRFITKLKYIDAIQFQGTGVGAYWYQHQIYRANGISDLDYSNAGRNAQPMAFDALCGAVKTQAPYLTYTGKDSYLKVDFINNSNNPVWVCIWPSKETALPASQTEAFEQAYSKYKVIASNSTTPKTTIYHKFNTAKMFGEGRSTVGTEDNYSAAYNAIPTDVWYWNVYLISCDGVTSLNLHSRIEILNTVEFSDRNQLTQS